IKIPADLLPNAISKFILEDIDLKTFFNNIVFNNNPNIQVNKVNTLVFPHPAESYLQFEVNINFKLI
ncbi:MAG: hypothetical protein NZZ41_03715, partial [Candidatus Dojkabacteria bacterium]|nr:hypothetical protein [Candidatus Dojkabacteria bacterium]